MADPKNKYAGLPGIASPDEKDVYETEDLPEADQGDYLDEPEAENIERPHLNARLAHEKFRGKRLIPSSNLDFSDAARRRPNIGYHAISGEWEIAAEGEPETIEQRRHRLEAEFRALIDDLNELKSAGKEKQEGMLAETLVPELEDSLKQLSQIQIPQFPGCLSTKPDQHIANIQNLIKDFKQKQGKPPATTTKSNDEPVVTYQLGMFPAQAQFGKSARLSDLELRLKQLETVLGATPENINRLNMTEFKSISEAVSELSSRTNVLDLNTIDAMDTKLGNLVGKLDAINEKRGGPQQAELESKVNELYDSYRKVEALSQTLLPLVDRLAALTSLHQQAGEFKSTLAQLKLEIATLATKKATDDAVIESLQEGMKELVSTVTANIASFNARLAAVQK